MSIFKNLTTRALIALDKLSVPVRRAIRNYTQGSPAQDAPPIVTTTVLTGDDAARVTDMLKSGAGRARVQGVFDSGDDSGQRSLTDILSVDSSQVQKAIMELGATGKRVIIMPQRNWGADFKDPRTGELNDAALTIAEMARRKNPGEERKAWSYKPLYVNRGETEPIEVAIARTLSDGLSAEIKSSEIDREARKALNDGGDAIVIFRDKPTLTNLSIGQIKTPMTMSSTPNLRHQF